MPTRVLFVFATSTEADILKRIPAVRTTDDGYSFGKTVTNILVTGAGGISTAWAMTKWLDSNPHPDLAINAGIAGSYSAHINIGDVVLVGTDCFADLGVESGNRLITLAEAGLMNPDMFPFEGGIIRSRNRYFDMVKEILQKVNGITVNTCTGSLSSIERLRNKFNPDIETMEGATFFYICAREKISFLGVRAISNKVEPDNRDSWNIPFALQNLAEKIKEILLMLD